MEDPLLFRKRPAVEKVAFHKVWRCTLPVLFLLLFVPAFFLAREAPTHPRQLTGPIRLEVSFDAAARSEPASGRLLLLVSRTERFSPGVTGTPVFGKNVNDLGPGELSTFDDTDFGYPVRKLSDLPAGDYFVKAWLNVYTTFKRADGRVVKLHMDQGEGQNWQKSPGNLFSETVKLHFGNDSPEPAPLVMNRVVPPLPEVKDTHALKHIRIQSRLLTGFWGRPIYIGANILLPEGYDQHPELRYPVHYIQGHFPRSGAPNPGGKSSGVRPRFIQVTFEHACPYYDDSYGVNSENVGPYGDAILTELIPEIERRFRAIRKSWGRVLSGGSTGGWISLALQVYHPDFFGGTWSFCPDPVDFHKYQVIDIYGDANAYFVGSDWVRVPRGASRDTAGNIRYTMEQECLYEEAIGSRCRSGGQWAIWNAVFAPVAEDGYPKPLWDPLTGQIDREVVKWAGEHYDLRQYLERNWTSLGSRLAGKIHVYCGRMDNFYLNEACYLLQCFLERAVNPAYGGEFRYGERAGHGWTPFEGDELLHVMADHILKTSPGGNRDWIY